MTAEHWIAVALTTLALIGAAAFVLFWRLIGALVAFRTDLVTHQRDDCKRLDALDEKVTTQIQLAKDMVLLMDQIKTYVTEKYDELAERVERHQNRGEQVMKELRQQLGLDQPASNRPTKKRLK